jgi:hypothetical protein
MNYKFYISVTSSLSPGFIYLRGEKDDMSSKCGLKKEREADGWTD